MLAVVERASSLTEKGLWNIYQSCPPVSLYPESHSFVLRRDSRKHGARLCAVGAVPVVCGSRRLTLSEGPLPPEGLGTQAHRHGSSARCPSGPLSAVRVGTCVLASPWLRAVPQPHALPPTLCPHCVPCLAPSLFLFAVTRTVDLSLSTPVSCFPFLAVTVCRAYPQTRPIHLPSSSQQSPFALSLAFFLRSSVCVSH